MRDSLLWLWNVGTVLDPSWVVGVLVLVAVSKDETLGWNDPPWTCSSLVTRDACYNSVVDAYVRNVSVLCAPMSRQITDSLSNTQDSKDGSISGPS